MLLPRGYIVRTGPVVDLASELSRLLELAEMGLVCVAPPRTGKTSALQYLSGRFQERESAVCLNSHIVPYREKNRAAKFFRRLRGDADGDDASMVQWNPHRALINHVRNECDKLESPTVVFTLDEAQNLTVMELDILKEVTEELISHRLRPFVLLMAQEEMSFFADWLRENQRRDLLHRFMLHHHRFRGLRQADVDAVLQHLDTATWPEGSHITYTQHFLPSLWKGGWRIAESGELLWAAFERHGQKLGFEPATLEVGTQFVCASALLLLRRIQEDPRRRATHALFDEVVAASGFRESKVLTVLTPDQAKSQRRRTVGWYKATGH